MPICATAALASSLWLAAPPRAAEGRHSNPVLDPTRKKPVFAVAAAGRFGALVGSGDAFVQPIGFGFGIHIHAWPLVVRRARLGITFVAGHTMFPERQTLYVWDSGTYGVSRLRRWTVLSHTDITLGPSFEVPVKRVLLGGGLGMGLNLGQLRRPDPTDVGRTQQITSPDFMLRGGVALGVPIRRNFGLTLGVGVQHPFSRRAVAVDPVEQTNPDGSAIRVGPFSTMLDVHLGYQAWF